MDESTIWEDVERLHAHRNELRVKLALARDLKERARELPEVYEAAEMSVELRQLGFEQTSQRYSDEVKERVPAFVRQHAQDLQRSLGELLISPSHAQLVWSYLPETDEKTPFVHGTVFLSDTPYALNTTQKSWIRWDVSTGGALWAPPVSCTTWDGLDRTLAHSKRDAFREAWLYEYAEHPQLEHGRLFSTLRSPLASRLCADLRTVGESLGTNVFTSARRSHTQVKMFYRPNELKGTAYPDDNVPVEVIFDLQKMLTDKLRDFFGPYLSYFRWAVTWNGDDNYIDVVATLPMEPTNIPELKEYT